MLYFVVIIGFWESSLRRVVGVEFIGRVVRLEKGKYIILCVKEERRWGSEGVVCFLYFFVFI